MKREASLDEIIEAMKEIWDTELHRHTGLPLEGNVPLSEDAKEIQRTILGQLLDVHPLTEIIKSGLQDVVEQTEAFETLRGKPTSIAHARAVEETSAIFEYILKAPDRYNEFRWRWDSAQAVHAIRNRHFNLKKPLEHQHQDWIKENAKQLRQYVKITGAPPVDEKAWLTYSNWLYRISLKDVFETTGRGKSYSLESYEWANHFTHFSPIGDQHSLIMVDGGRSYFDVFGDFLQQQIYSLLRILLPSARQISPIRLAHAAGCLRILYQLFKNDPKRAVRLGSHERVQTMVGVFLERPINMERVELALLGGESQDPLLLKL
ncbi:hypothetical protein [Myxococcus stipitatus]|uniref:hypothetical protein n=1 Tax=Myxococcus stipitatus TaxID=83455 RepID=UPI0030CE265E